MKRLLKALTELSSQKWISVIAGKMAKSRLSKSLIPHFAKIYGIRLEEAEKQWNEYESLNAFFTRRLKQGLRNIDGDPDVVVSPVDGVITAMGKVTSDKVMHIKGQEYTVPELLNHAPRSVNYKHGYFFVLYLSPTDYHRIHAPVTGKIVEKEHILGKVYPVHDFSLTHIPRVLSRNERLVSYFQHAQGEIAVVKVGALNVCSIRYVDDNQTEYAKGEELAYFEFGSTVVLLTEKDTFLPNSRLREGDKIQMGESLGKLKVK